MMSRSHLILSVGDWTSSIENRNAHGRLRASAALDVFDHVEYSFFRTTRSRRFSPESWISVNEISGRDGTGGPVFKATAFGNGLRELIARAREAQPAVVTAAEPFISGPIGLLLARSLGVPFVQALVSHYRQSWNIARVRPTSALPTRLAFAVQDWVFRNADLVLTDRQFYADYALASGAPPARVIATPMWAESAFHEFTPDPGVLARHGIADPTPVVYVGRLSPEKYSDDLLYSFARIRESHPARELVVVGGTGPMREWFISEAAQMGLSDAVHVVFADGPAEVGALMNVAGVVLAPHAGYTLLEGMLCGAVTVAYDFEWHGEMVAHEERGLMVPYRDWKAMADAGLRILESPDEHARYSAASMAFARTHHAQSAVIAGVNDAYRRLLAGSI